MYIHLYTDCSLPDEICLLEPVSGVSRYLLNYAAGATQRTYTIQQNISKSSTGYRDQLTSPIPMLVHAAFTFGLSARRTVVFIPAWVAIESQLSPDSTT